MNHVMRSCEESSQNDNPYNRGLCPHWVRVQSSAALAVRYVESNPKKRGDDDQRDDNGHEAVVAEWWTIVTHEELT
jgi:hypothetical protein